MEITDVVWFGATKPVVGAVLGIDKTTGEHKAYIGGGAGFDEQGDIKHITEYGSPIKIQHLNRILTHLKTKS